MADHASPPARFVTGSTMRHVVVMTASGALGLVAIFVVDLLSLLYISRLGDPGLTAGVGFATVVGFFGISINVGLMIATGALVGKALGAGDREGARRLAGTSLVHLLLAATVVSLLLLALLPWLLAQLGASAEALPAAERFLWITLPSNPLMALGMGLSTVLRAVGDARRAMTVTLWGAVVTLVLDPLAIFWLGLGVEGAAIVVVLSRVAFLASAAHGAIVVHRLVRRPTLAEVREDFAPVVRIGLPAVLTNLAPPVANAFFAGIMARYGDAVVAAAAIIDRVVPVVFGGVFALSGAVGPILAQNWGAGRFDRMRAALRDSVLFMALYVGAAWGILLAGQGILPLMFAAEPETARIVAFFCWVSGPTWFLLGLLFVANASFNNLGFPFLSTAFNWGRATLGTVPVAYLGARWYGPEGALMGVGLGALFFGLAGVLTAFGTIGRLERREASAGPVARPQARP